MSAEVFSTAPENDFFKCVLERVGEVSAPLPMIECAVEVLRTLAAEPCVVFTYTPYVRVLLRVATDRANPRLLACVYPKFSAAKRRSLGSAGEPPADGRGLAGFVQRAHADAQDVPRAMFRVFGDSGLVHAGARRFVVAAYEKRVADVDAIGHLPDTADLAEREATEAGVVFQRGLGARLAASYRALSVSTDQAPLPSGATGRRVMVGKAFSVVLEMGVIPPEKGAKEEERSAEGASSDEKAADDVQAAIVAGIPAGEVCLTYSLERDIDPVLTSDTF